jgi:hypothetical protein
MAGDSRRFEEFPTLIVGVGADDDGRPVNHPKCPISPDPTCTHHVISKTLARNTIEQ